VLQVMLSVALLAGIDGTGAVACSSVDDNRERLACYDAIFRSVPPGARAGVSTAGQSATPAAPVALAAESGAAGSNPEAGFGLAAEQQARAAPERSPAVDAISSRVVAVKALAYDRLSIRLENGQLWSQIESMPRQRFFVGDEITIRKAVFGSFLASGPHSGALIRVRRAE
jgi:hypothetical protein